MRIPFELEIQPPKRSLRRMQGMLRGAAELLQQAATFGVILDAAGVPASAWIWIHAQGEADSAQYLDAAQRGAWISLDGVSANSLEAHLDRVLALRDAGLLHRVLVSQDAGWYSVGEPDGGTLRPYDLVFTRFIPALRERGLTDDDVERLFVRNPAEAFAIAGV